LELFYYNSLVFHFLGPRTWTSENEQILGRIWWLSKHDIIWALKGHFLNVWSAENEGKCVNFVHNNKRMRYTLHWDEEKPNITTLKPVTACAKPHTAVIDTEDWTSSSWSMRHDLCHAPHGRARQFWAKNQLQTFCFLHSIATYDHLYDVQIYFPMFSKPWRPI
jgi:hypothetical protein